MEISKSFTFDAAHMLALERPSKCRSLHGHTYSLVVKVSGTLNAEGMVLDYTRLGEIVKPLVDAWDHRFLVPRRFVDLSTHWHVNQVEVRYPDFVARLPAEMVAILEAPQSTAEHLAQEMHVNLSRAGILARAGLVGHTVEVSETPKTKAVWP